MGEFDMDFGVVGEIGKFVGEKKCEMVDGVNYAK